VTDGPGRRKHVDAASKFLGVFWCAPKWGARIYIDHVIIHLGMFAMEEGAALAYNEAVTARGLDWRINKVEPSLVEASSRSKMSSKYTGVSRKRERWVSQIFVAGNNKRLGTFDTEDEAALACNAAVEEHKLKRSRLYDVPRA
jgi:hypothetical protein